MTIDKQFLENLNSKVLSHAAFQEVVDTVLGKIQYDKSTGFGLVVGVTGVGKTTVMRRLVRILGEYVSSEAGGEYGPPIVLTMASPERQVFSWADFYRTSLVDGIRDPFFEKRIDLNDALIGYIRDGIRRRSRTSTIPALRAAFIEGTNRRRPIALFIDEIQQLCKVTSRDKAHMNLDVLKTISDIVLCPVIGVGTSLAYQMLYENEQMARRSDVINFRRYGASDEDAAEYRDVVSGIKDELGIPLAEEVARDPAYFYRGSLGCVGITMDWVLRALALCAMEGGRVVTRKHLDRKKLGEKAIAALAKAVKAADAMQAESKDFDVVNWLGEQNSVYGHAKRKSDPGAAKPGRRKPKLDPVGGLRDEMKRDLR